MEDRAKYVLIGLFTFAVVAAAFGFIYWLHNTSGSKETANYRVIFDGSVSGLRVGGPVMFNGIRIGQVTDMGLTDDPSQVAAVITINKDTPIRTDTRVSLEYAGLTGIASVSLRGNNSKAPALVGKAGVLPTLSADPNSGTDMSTAVRETLGRADAVIAENQESLRNTIKNLETFTAALARNGEKIDRLVDSSMQAVGSVNELAVSLKKDTSELAASLDKRTAEITEGVNTLTGTATKHIEIVGNDIHRTVVHIDKVAGNIDKSVSDLAKNPQRFIFGGSSK
ncbi:MAG TPA: MlaD family protein [Pseudolabrys sp.]|nr:MlaD family protein [Pseudolabrys sp.]